MNFFQSIFGRLRTWITDIWKRTERRDRLRFTVIAGISVVLLIAAFVMLGAAGYEKLADAADPAVMAGVTGLLEENNIRYKVDGTAVMVDSGDLARASGLVALNEQVGTEVDYSVYAAATGLTSTESEKRYYERAQREVHIKQALEGAHYIINARVNLNYPDNKGVWFESEKQPATAGIAVTLAEGAELTQKQVAGMESWISSAAGIAPENINIVDQFMNPLNLKMEDDPATKLASQLAYQKAVETNLIDKVNSLLMPVLGSHFSFTLNAIIDFDKRNSEGVTFAPVVDEDGIRISWQKIKESAIGRTAVGGEPGLDEDGAGDEYSVLDDTDLSQYEKDTETINYHVNEMRESITRAQGTIIDLSATLVIDTTYITDDAPDKDGNRTNDGVLTQATLDAMRDLVISAIGLTAASASRVEVQGHQMVGVQESIAGQEGYEAAMARERTYALIQTLVLYAIIALCVILLVWRTLALFKPKTIEVDTEDDDYLVGSLQEYGDLVEAAVSSMELEVTKSSSRERVEEFIETNPDAVANMLRSWLSDEGESAW